MTTPPAGPPPGYPHGTPPQGPPQGPPPGYGPPPAALNQPPKPPPVRGANMIWALGIVALAGVILGLSIKEDGHNAWDSVHAWGAVAIVGAAATLAPVLGRSFARSAERLGMVAACGAGALVLFWVLFTLPSVGSNTSLLVTVGVAAGIIAAWFGAGRPDGAPRRTW